MLFLLSGLVGGTAGCAASGPPVQETTAEEAASEKQGEKISDGYGQKEKRDETGAVGSVPVEKTRRGRAPSHLSDLLRGSVSGVHVSRGANGGVVVRIRGASSIYGSNAPLYVVDGVSVQPERGGALPWLNPRDVKSITVLKGTSASIYGSRGANGVIVIKTN